MPNTARAVMLAADEYLGLKKRHKICFVFVTYFLIMVILISANNESNTISLVGGIVGLFYSTIVSIALWEDHAHIGASSALLFYRSLCDIGSSSRFALGPLWNYNLCGTYGSCQRTGSDEMLCSVPSAYLEFFVISSEAWFLLNGVDLYYSISKPFSSFHSRKLFYHIFVWTVSILFTFSPFWYAESQNTYGFWFIVKDGDNAFCWLNSQSTRLNIWYYFFIPVLAIYVFGLSTLVFAYSRLRKGITKTFLPRMRLLVTNTVNVVSLLLFWLAVLLLYVVAYSSSSKQINYIVLYLLSSKGVVSYIVYVLVSDNRLKNDWKEKELGDQVGSNAALREEVLNLATAGIRSSTRSARHYKPSRCKVSRRPPKAISTSISNTMTPMIFLRFMFNMDQEVAAVGTMMTATKSEVVFSTEVFRGKEKSCPRADTRPRERQSEYSVTENPLSCPPHANVESDDDRYSVASTVSSISMSSTRFSQRDTVVNGMRTESGNNQQRNTDIESVESTVEVKNSQNTNVHEDEQKTGAVTVPPLNRFKPTRLLPKMPWNVTGENFLRTTTDSGRPSDMIEQDEDDDDDDDDDDEEDDRVSNTEDRNTDTSLPSDRSKSSTWSKRSRRGKRGFFSDYYRRFMYWTRSSFVDASEFVEFTEFLPYHFQQIRLSVGITDDVYIDYFSTTIKERLTEGGASGAFFFFSKDEKFIAKSCTQEELDVIKKNGVAYSKYLVQNPGSCLSKIYGAYRLQIYGNILCFFVMNNILLNPENLVMHEKYDIKGSWVARNAALPRSGRKVTCTHCQQKFLYTKKKRRVLGRQDLKRENSNKSTITKNFSGVLPFNIGSSADTSTESLSSDQLEKQQYCPYTVNGQHEPTVILKDNDLKYKIKLPLESAEGLVRQLQSDTDFLLSVGIMDYSLLVGVHNTEYEVRSPPGKHKTGSMGEGNGAMAVAVSCPAEEMWGTIHMDDSPSRISALQVGEKGAGAAVARESGVMASDLAATNLLKRSSHTDGGKKLEVLRVSGPDSYYMGIIDFQQTWTWEKKIERFVKCVFRGADPDGLSAIQPDIYRDRFLQKMEDILDLDTDDRVPSVNKTAHKQM